MAGKAQHVVKVDCKTLIATIRFPNGKEYTYSLGSLDKNTLIRMYGTVFNRKFTGGTPLGKTKDEIYDTVKRACEDVVATGGTTVIFADITDAKPVERPPAVERILTPRETPPVVANNTDRVANAVRDVISDALRSVGIDEEAVKGLIAKALESERVTTYEMIKDTRPIVTQVVLPTGAVRPVEGITHEIFPKVLKAVARGQHIWMTGSAGAGKTTIAEQVAKALGVEFSSDSYNSQSSKADIKGYKSVSDNLYQSTGFRERFEHGGVYLLDEIDASNPNILTTLNSALSNASLGFPDGMVKRHPKFVAIAAANTWGNGATAEHVGRVAIDGATIDRFAMLHVKIDERMETELVRGTGIRMDVGDQWLNIVRSARRNVDTNGLKVIVSPRASIGGAHLLDSGFTWQETVDMRLLKGSKPEVANKIMAGIVVPSGAPIA